MDANQVKQELTENDLLTLLTEFGAEPQEHGSSYFCRTICHNPAHTGKHKLIYYKESRMFRCYSDNCGSMDIYGLVGRIMDMDFFNSFKYICMKFGFSYGGDYVPGETIDTSFFNKFKKRNPKTEMKALDGKILNSYHELYHKSWVDDGISTKSMKKFGIRFSIMDNQIIIPHYDIDGNLIGVRARNLNKEVVDLGMKYIPVYWKRNVLKHPTGAALYGLNVTKPNIEKYKTIILFEAEKSVLMLDTMMPDFSIGVCISGSSLSNEQLDIIKKLDVNEVVIAMDKEFVEVGSPEEKFYAEKIKAGFIDKLSPYFRISVIWDTKSLTDEKSSPTDHGAETFKILFENRIYI